MDFAASDPSYPLFPIFAFVGFFLSAIPFAWHLQAWNSGTCIYMFWTSLACLVQFVNSVVWHDNIFNPAPVWCDISTRFMIGAAVGIPAASLCINRRLYKIATMKTASITRREKQRAVIFDAAIGFGVPLFVMISYYIVQGHRFDILEDIGCQPVIINTAAAYPLVFIWPSVLGAGSFVYAGLSLRAFWRRRTEFRKIMTAHSSLTVNRYFRLMALASVDMLCSLPLSLFGIYINNVGVPLVPYGSWVNIHFNFSRVNTIPAFLWRSDRAFLISVELDRWVYPFCALLFFTLFGFAEEARKNYRALFLALARPFVRLSSWRKTYEPKRSVAVLVTKQSFALSDAKKAPILPVFIPAPPVHRKRVDSFASTIVGDASSSKGHLSLAGSSVTAFSEKKPEPSPPFMLPTMSGLGRGSLHIPKDVPTDVESQSEIDEHEIGVALTSSTPTTLSFSPGSSMFTFVPQRSPTVPLPHPSP